MTDRLRLDYLLTAQEALLHVMDDLDLSETSCGECGTRTYANFNDHLLGRKVSGMIAKIENETKKIKTGETHGRGEYHAGDEE